MYILIFSLVWITVIGLAAAAAWLEYGLADEAYPPYLLPGDTENPPYPPLSATLH